MDEKIGVGLIKLKWIWIKLYIPVTCSLKVEAFIRLKHYKE